MSNNHEQDLAISANEGNFLISAGAGSGKTKVLTDRVIRLLEEKRCTLDELLVLTFTEKAAAEMKAKIRDKLGKNEKTASLVKTLDNAYIMTFDAFARSIVSKYHYELGIPEAIDIADDSLLKVAEDRIVRDLLEEGYVKKDPALLALASAYAEKDDSHIRDCIKNVIETANYKIDKEAFYEDFEENCFSDSYIQNGINSLFLLARKLLGEVQDGIRNYSDDKKSQKQGEDENEFLKGYLSCGDYDSLYSKIQICHSYPSLSGKKLEEQSDKNIHASLAKKFKDAIGLLHLGDSETIKESYLKTKPFVMTIVRYAKQADDQLMAIKKKGGVYSFSDVAALAREAMKNEAIAQEMHDHFKYIMVDEYQDTSDLQAEFINSFKSTNVFEVGDLKQSIYRFRNANPDLFKDKRDLYNSNKREGTLITMGTNYRSRQGVLDDINSLFADIMSKGLGDIDYRDGQTLNFGAKDKYEGSEKSENRHFEIYTHAPDDLHYDAEVEANIVASDILNKVRGGYRLASGPAKFGDFAILTSRFNSFSTFKRIFAEAKIPLSATEHPNGASEDVTLCFRRIVHLISLLTDPSVAKRDKGLAHCYLSIRRSYLFSDDDQSLYDDISSKRYLKSPMFEMVDKVAPSIVNGSLYNGVEWIFANFPFFNNLPMIGNVKSNYERLTSIKDLARSMDKLLYSWADFDQYFKDSEKQDIEVPLSSPKPSKDAVQIMTIHASKGLEFPIVYLPDIDGRFNFKDAEGSFRCDGNYGLLLPPDVEGVPLSLFHLLDESDIKTKDRSERMRLFYVALTRAEEKIIFVMKKPKSLGEPLLKKPNSFSDFLLLGELPEKRYEEKKYCPILPYSEPAKEETLVPAPPLASILDKGNETLSIRPSKLSTALPNEEALIYGTRLHRYLELVDFKNKDTSWIKDERDRHIIDKVLSLPLFASLSEARIFHEYAFYDEENGIHGSIDLLIVHPGYEVIVDYKTKSIDDPAYLRQLDIYASYVEAHFHNRSKKYLLSILEATIEEIQ